MKRRLFLLTILMAWSIPSVTKGEDSAPWKRLTWTTSDGVKLIGLYLPAHGPKAYTWIFLHGLGSHKDEWKAFGSQLAAQGSGVFVYDARGHDESTQTTTGMTIDYKGWQTAGPGTPWDAMTADLASAVQMLHNKYGIAEKKIAIGGASLGANVALVYASEHPEVPALLLLSPGIEYAGINIQEAWKRYPANPRFMMAASPGDQYAYATVQRMCQMSSYSSCPAMEGNGSAHGVNMFKDDAFTKKLLDWMKGTELH